METNDGVQNCRCLGVKRGGWELLVGYLVTTMNAIYKEPACGCCVSCLVSWLEQPQVSLLQALLSNGQLRQQVLVRQVLALGGEGACSCLLSTCMLILKVCAGWLCSPCTCI